VAYKTENTKDNQKEWKAKFLIKISQSGGKIKLRPITSSIDKSFMRRQLSGSLSRNFLSRPMFTRIQTVEQPQHSRQKVWVTLHFTVQYLQCTYLESTWNRGRFRGRFRVSTSYYPVIVVTKIIT